MKLDFVVVGAAKSGTTSIFHYLNSHPNIFVPDVKECRFFSKLGKNFVGLGAECFANQGITDDSEYSALFDGHSNQVCGDISNDYLYYYERSGNNIKKYLNEDVKIIIFLRNPVERAYSNYMHHIRDGWEDCSFRDAINKEEQRINDNWGWSYHYKKVGLYYNQVKYYLDNFKYVKIFLFEDLKDIPNLLNDLYKFIDVVPNDDCLEFKEFNRSGIPKNKIIGDLVNRKGSLYKVLKPIVKIFIPNRIRYHIVSVLKNKNLKKHEMSAEDRNYLVDFYSEDIGKLSQLINRDLSHWLKKY